MQSIVNIYTLMAPVFWDEYDDVKAGRHSEYWNKGGRASTKSSFISLSIVRGIMKDPGANALIFRKVGATLMDSVYAQIVWAIGELGCSHLFRYLKAPMEIIYKPTGQRIMFRGADDPRKSKSIKLSKGHFKYLWFEELTEFQGMEAIRTIKQSVFRGVDNAVTFYSYNPPRSAQNWVNEEYLKHTDLTKRFVHHSTYLDVPPEWLRGSFLEDAETLRQTNERAWRNEYLGEITGTGGQVFDNVQLRDITDEELKGLGNYYNGLDFGFAGDPDACTRWAYSPRTRMLYAVKEFYASHNLTDTLAGKVKEIVGSEIVWCDSEAPRDIAELRQRSVNAIAAQKGPGSVKAGIKWLQNLAGIVVDARRTPNIAREFASYEYMQDRHGNFLPDVPDKDNHTIDSGRYALSQLILQRTARTRNDVY